MAPTLPAQNIPPDTSNVIIEKPHRQYLGFIVIFFFGLLLGAGGIYLNNQTTKQSKKIIPPIIQQIISPTMTQPPRYFRGDATSILLGDNKLAYIKDNQIYLKDITTKQLTENKDVNEIKWSQDGKYIAWSGLQKIQALIPTPEPTAPVNYPSTEPQIITISANIHRLDISSGTDTVIIPPQYDGKQLAEVYYNDPHSVNIDGFDFYPQDSSKIVYARNGIWVHDIKMNTDEQLLQNDPRESMLQGQGSSNIEVESNPRSKMLLIELGYWENNGYALYNIETRQKTIIEGLHCKKSFWSRDGQTIISYAANGFCEGGLWLTPVANLTPKTILSAPFEQSVRYNSVMGLTTNDHTDLFAIIDPWTKDGLQDKMRALYKVSDGNKTDLLKALPESELLRMSPDSTVLAYLSHCVSKPNTTQECELHIMKTDGSNDSIIDTRVTNFIWSPQ